MVKATHIIVEPSPIFDGYFVYVHIWAGPLKLSVCNFEIYATRAIDQHNNPFPMTEADWIEIIRDCAVFFPQYEPVSTTLANVIKSLILTSTRIQTGDLYAYELQYKGDSLNDRILFIRK